MNTKLIFLSGLALIGSASYGASVPSIHEVKGLAKIGQSVAISYFATKEALIQAGFGLGENSERVVTLRKSGEGDAFQVQAKFYKQGEELRLTADGVAFEQAAYPSLDNLVLVRKPVPVP